uniref:Uncharacterized protein n=1 Tax=Moniliophthora roreri TaxID=221103 RepID=A0A0W0EU15_MONRR
MPPDHLDRKLTTGT